MIEKQYLVTVTYIPDSGERGIIKRYDEVIDEIMSLDSRMVLQHHTPASDAYYECIADTLQQAQQIEKKIEAILTKYKYRVV